jgi:bifunctional non-homologous end joining protein LigD
MLVFVVHKHAATSLHYDFRLELDGVLVSWAVPKGPSLDPRHKRLAMRVEDHAMAHAKFEGLYERGGAILWDRGTWAAVEGRDARADQKRGRMSFVLHGEKLRGVWHLVRRAADEARESWVLFKGADSEARRTGSIVDDAPKSVVSGLTLDELLHRR